MLNYGQAIDKLSLMDPLTFLILAVGLGGVVLWISALANLAKYPHGNAVSVTLWVLIVLVAPIIGAVMWFAVGQRLLATRA